MPSFENALPDPPDAGLRPCPTCGTPVRFDAATIVARGKLDFLLTEMRIWGSMNLLPAPMLAPLLREYSYRRARLENNWANQLDLELGEPAPAALPIPATAPVTAAAPPRPSNTVLAGSIPFVPLSPPKPSRVNVVTEFLESRNIAALHIIGSLLLLTGLFVLVRMQWETWGRYLLLLTLATLTASLSFGGRRLAGRDSVGGLILSALGALILPLNFVALYLFGFFGSPGVRSADITGLAGSLGCGIIYTLTLRRTRHPIFATLVALAGAGAAFSTVRLLLPGIVGASASGGFAYAIGFLPTAQLYFYIARRLHKNGEPGIATPFAYVGHGLMGAGVALGFLGGSPGDNDLLKKGLIAALSAGIYADAAIRLRIPWLAYLAALAAVVAGQLVVGANASPASRGLLLAITALVLYLLSRFLERRTPADSEPDTEVYAQATRIYRQSAIWISRVTATGYAIIAMGDLLALDLWLDTTILVKAFVAALITGFVLLYAALGDQPRRSYLYPAFAAVFVLVAASVGMIAHALPALIWLRVPGVTGLLFALTILGLRNISPRANPRYTMICDEVRRVETALFVVLPWLYIGSPESALRDAHLGLTLPGLALVSAAAAWRNRATADNPAPRHGFDLHLTTLALGSLSLFAGASAGFLPIEQRGLWAAFGGGIMALVFGVVALGFPPLRAALSTDAMLLAVIAFLPLTPFVLDGGAYLSQTLGILVLLATVWAIAAPARAENRPLYGAGTMLILAGWLFSKPLDAWATAHGVVPGHLRWGGGLLLFTPLLFAAGHLLQYKQTDRAPDYAPPVFRTAITGAIIAGIGQLVLTAGVSVPLAAAGVETLWLMALAFSLYGTLRRDTRALHGAVVPLVCGYLPFLVRHWLIGEAWMLTPWAAVATHLLIGGMWLYTGQRQDRLGTMRGGAILLITAYLHTLFQVLPPVLHFAWGLALLPLFGGMCLWNRGVLRPFALTCVTLAAVAFLVDVPASSGYQSLIGLEATRIYLLVTIIAYAAALLADGMYHDDRIWLLCGITVATVGGTFWAAGYPNPGMMGAQIALTLTCFGGFWYGGTLLLTRFRPALAETMTNAALFIAGLGAVLAFVTGEQPEMLPYSIGALLLACALFTTRARQMPASRWHHVAFAAGFAAFSLYLRHSVGLTGETIDLYFIPLGIYLILLGGRVLYRDGKGDDLSEGISPADLETAKSLCGIGLLLMLAPTLVSTIYDATTWWHPFLLVAECLIAIGLGIGYRLRIFLGFGIAFLVALLGVKAYQPGQQKSFAFYLTILGGLTLVLAIYFDRRRSKGQKDTTLIRGTGSED